MPSLKLTSSHPEIKESHYTSNVLKNTVEKMLDFELSSIFTGNASVCNLRDSVSSSDCHIFSKLLGRSKAKIYSSKW